MELYTVRGGSREDVLAKKYNIAVGISLGNRWFTPDNTFELIKWSLENTREYVVVHVADTIHAINLEVRNRINKTRALNIAKRRGKEILTAMRERALSLPEADYKRLYFSSWDGIFTPEYREKLKYLYNLYEQESDLKATIHKVVKDYTKSEDKNFSEEEIHRLGCYIVEELPELISRVPIDGKVFDANAYPYDNVPARLAEQIQKGKFPEIREHIMDTKPKVFLEVR